MATDLELVFENARIYNMDESKLYLVSLISFTVFNSKNTLNDKKISL